MEFPGVQGKARGRARKPRDPSIARGVLPCHFKLPGRPSSPPGLPWKPSNSFKPAYDKARLNEKSTSSTKGLQSLVDLTKAPRALKNT